MYHCWQPPLPPPASFFSHLSQPHFTFIAAVKSFISKLDFFISPLLRSLYGFKVGVYQKHVCIKVCESVHSPAIIVNFSYILEKSMGGLWAFTRERDEENHLPWHQSSETQVYLYVLSVLLLIYSSPNFTEQESVADIEYGSIDHSPGCILSADWALRQMPSL